MLEFRVGGPVYGTGEASSIWKWNGVLCGEPSSFTVAIAACHTVASSSFHVLFFFRDSTFLALSND